MKALTVPQLAARYGCSERTVFRWKAHGVDVQDPYSVAGFVEEHPGQSLATLSAIIDAMQAVPKIDGEMLWLDAFAKALKPTT